MSNKYIEIIIFTILIISFFSISTIFLIIPESEKTILAEKEFSNVKENRNCEQLLQIITAVEKQSVRNIASSNWIEQECWK